MTLLLRVSDPGWLISQMRRLLLVEKHGQALQAVYIAAFLLVSTFGAWIAGVLVALGTTWRRLPMIVWIFPIITIVNYLITSMGLAMDKHQIGSPEELLNRPLVWAYFAVAAWTAAAAYRFLLGEGLPRGRGVAAAAVVLVVCLCANLYSAPNLQTYPQYKVPTFATGGIPVCMVDAAHYVRKHSAVTDLVEDAAADNRFRLSALSERQLYVGSEIFGGVSDLQTARLAELKAVMQLTDAGAVQRFFQERRIGWYLQRPETKLAWPEAGLPQPVYSCGGFKLYRFAGA